MIFSDLNTKLTELTDDVVGLQRRQPSAGRRLLMMSVIADIDELRDQLATDVLTKVNREIVLDADDGISYASTAENLQTLQPIQMIAAADDETETLEQLEESLSALIDTLFAIADALDRRRKDEDYVKLYEDEMKKFTRARGLKNAELSYTQWLDKECLGAPTIEDLEDYRLGKLNKLFATGIFADHVAKMQRAKHYADEVVLEPAGSDVQIDNIHRHYHCLRQLCTYQDHSLEVLPAQAGKFFYFHRHDVGAREHRRAFMKYMAKINFAQRDMAEMRHRRQMRISELTPSRKEILERLAEFVGYGEWVNPATDVMILEMLHNALGVGAYELTGEDLEMSETLWAMMETGNLRVVWQNLIGYFDEHLFFNQNLGSPALNIMFFDNTDMYQNIDKGRPSYNRKSKKWAKVQPLLDRFVPQKE